MKGAVAAGHRLTAEAGARILAEGGNAVDACVAAAFAAWVTESPLTGPGAGGFALVRPGDGRPARLADFFVATPGYGREPAESGQMEAVDIGYGDAEATQVFRIGSASCAVPGARPVSRACMPSTAVCRGRSCVQPAIELARSGVELTRPQAHLHAILDLILRHTLEGRRLYSRDDGSRLQPGDLLVLPDLGRTLEQIAAEGAAAMYRGELAVSIAATIESGGGLLTTADLEAYRVIWREPVQTRYLGHDVISNPPPSSGGVLIAYGLALLDHVARGRPGSAETVATLVETMREQTRARSGSFVEDLYAGGLVERLLDEESVAGGVARIRASLPGAPEHAPNGGTTHVSALDADGNAASVSSSTGSGSGVIVPGTGIQLNNMLGEYDLVGSGPAEPGSVSRA